MTPDRPDETLAPLPDHDFDDDGICRVCEMDACDHASNISGCRSWADADALRAEVVALTHALIAATYKIDELDMELGRERRLSAEKDAQLAHKQELLDAACGCINGNAEVASRALQREAELTAKLAEQDATIIRLEKELSELKK